MRYVALAVIATCCSCLAVPASATQPVSKIVLGCVQAGRLSADGYVYRLTHNDNTEFRDIDLTGFEGKTVRVEGQLLPGDVLVADTIKVIAEDCQVPP